MAGLLDLITKNTMSNKGFGGEDEEILAPTEEEITVDGFKPRKRNFLQKLGDAVLMYGDEEPAWANNIRQQNITDAMEGFTDDPIATIRRLSRIPGMQEKAMSYYDKYQDNEQARVAGDSLTDSRKEKYLTRIGGMLYRVRKAKDPKAAYSAILPVLRRYAKSNDVDVADLSDEYNEDSINTYIDGSVSPEDQIRMEALERYRGERLALEEVKEQGRNERLEATEGGKDRRQATSEAGKDRRTPPRKGKNGERVISTVQGPGILSADGTTLGMRIKGKKVVYLRQGKKWVKYSEEDAE